jgi:hypothetical protein
MKSCVDATGPQFLSKCMKSFESGVMGPGRNFFAGVARFGRVGVAGE